MTLLTAKLAQDVSKLQEMIGVSRVSKACVTAAYLGSVFAKNLQNHVLGSEQWKKQDQSPVCVADLAVQALVVHVLQHFATLEKKNIKVLAEENLSENTELDLNLVVDRLNSFVPFNKLAEILPPYADNEKTQMKKWNVSYLQESYSKTAVESNQDLKDLIQDDNCFGDCYFVLDPIDGTEGFLNQQHFAVALCALNVRSGETEKAVIACPNLPEQFEIPKTKESYVPVSSENMNGQLFYAIRNEGAWTIPSAVLNASVISKPVQLSINATKNTELPPILTCLESATAGHSNRTLLQRFLDRLGHPYRLLRMHSIGKYCLVARGDGNVLLRFPKRDYKEKVWDILPGKLILEEAGGCITHGDGSKICGAHAVELENTSGIVVTGTGGTVFHKNLLEAIRLERASVQDII